MSTDLTRRRIEEAVQSGEWPPGSGKPMSARDFSVLVSAFARLPDPLDASPGRTSGVAFALGSILFEPISRDRAEASGLRQHGIRVWRRTTRGWESDDTLAPVEALEFAVGWLRAAEQSGDFTPEADVA
jgi:hypothetical protein